MTLDLLERKGAGSAGVFPAAAKPPLQRDPAPTASPVLAIEGMTVCTDHVDLVLDATLQVAPGETLCVVGESGCGKSLTCLAAMGLLADPVRMKSGSITLNGKELGELNERQFRRIRGRDMAMIFQDPGASLNPVQRVGRQVAEALVIHKDMAHRAALRKAIELLDRVGIPDPHKRAEAYPHQLSGGMCQRVMIAMALACEPKLMIADEATTALDVTTQAQILKLIKTLQDESGTAMIFVTHDLSVVAEIADRVAVMYSGRIVETGSVDAIFDHPGHPYTKGLMDCRLHALTAANDRLAAIGGTVPRPADRPVGCAFRPRCPKAAERCAELPEPRPFKGGQAVACHFPGLH